jgi:glutathione S-transferase
MVGDAAALCHRPEMELKLFFSPGACSRVAMIALEEIGTPFETHLVAFMAGEHRGADYLALNPAGKVPLLIADGRALTQNVAILTFLARSFPEANLLPFTGDTYEDSTILSWLSRCASDLHPLVTRIRIPAFFCDLPEAPARVREMAEIAMAAQLAPIEAALADRPWLLGDRWSLVDAYFHWLWFRISGAGFDTGPFPNIVDFNRRVETRPAVRRAIAREEAATAELESRGLAVRFAPVAVPA